MPHPVVFLVLFGSVLRVGVWYFHGVGVISGEAVSAAIQADCHGILNDPMRLIAWEHTRPPLLAVREILKCAMLPVITPWRLDLLMVACADVAATVLLFATFRRLSVGGRTAFAVAAVWSLALIAWEYYRGGGSHNHLNIAIITLFLFAALRRFQEPGLARDLLFAAAAALLCMSYGPAMLIVPLVAVGTVRRHLGLRRIAASLLLGLCLPALAIGATVAKNFSRFGVMSTSTYLGPNLAQFAYIAMGYEAPDAKLEALLPKLDPGPWWTWCFEQARGDRPAGALRALHGQCLDFDDPRSLRAGLDQAEALGDKVFSPPLKRDLAVAEAEPWLLRIGYPPMMTTETEVVFAKTARKVWKLMLQQDPGAILRTSFQALRSFFIWGPLMFDGVHHEPALALAPTPVNWMATGLAAVSMLGVVGGAVMLLAAAFRIAVALPRDGIDAVRMIGPEVFFLCVILAAFFSVAAVLSAIACCENGRQFQSLSPIPMVVGGYLLAAGLRRLAVS